ELLLGTATLMERERPYHLTVELARGSLNRLRNQIAVWQTLGMTVSDAAGQQISQAKEQLSRAVTSQSDPLAAHEFAQRALELALAATAQVGREYAEQSLALRRKQSLKTTTLLGVNLGSAPASESLLAPLVSTFNSATVPLAWREIETLEGQRDW